MNVSKSVIRGPWFPHLPNGNNIISSQGCCIKCNNNWERALKSAMSHEGKVALFLAKTFYKDYQLLRNKMEK